MDSLGHWVESFGKGETLGFAHPCAGQQDLPLELCSWAESGMLTYFFLPFLWNADALLTTDFSGEHVV